jgi:hypothetical protein
MFASVMLLKLVTRADRNGSWLLYCGFHFSGDGVDSRRVCSPRNMVIKNDSNNKWFFEVNLRPE